MTIEADIGASFSGLIRPGDRVDIRLQDTAGKTPPTWFFDIPVIAVDRQFDRPPDTDAAADTSSITVSVTPEEGRRLAAAPAGSLRWFLRNPEDRSRPSLPPRTTPEGSRVVEIWRAGVRDTGIRTAAAGVPE